MGCGLVLDNEQLGLHQSGNLPLLSFPLLLSPVAWEVFSACTQTCLLAGNALVL